VIIAGGSVQKGGSIILMTVIKINLVCGSSTEQLCKVVYITTSARFHMFDSSARI